MRLSFHIVKKNDEGTGDPLFSVSLVNGNGTLNWIRYTTTTEHSKRDRRRPADFLPETRFITIAL